MFIFIPGELIALVTFPGVIIHEISHRFFCDLYNVAVYEINYFRPLSKRAGHVLHMPTKNFYHAFFIACAPLIINSIVCMLLTFPCACRAYLGTSFIEDMTSSFSFLYGIMTWIGFSAGWNAMPSDHDVSGLLKLAESESNTAVAGIIIGLATICNLPFIGYIFNGLFVLFLTMLLPVLFIGPA